MSLARLVRTLPKIKRTVVHTYRGSRELMNGVGSGQNRRLAAQTVIADDIHAICLTTVPLGT